MTDEQLKLLFLVAEKGSFSKAEESGYVSKQAILKQINKLEEELGFPLFDRGKKGVRLTEAGSHFVSGIKKLQTQKEKLIKHLKSKPKDFTFNDAETLLGYFDYTTAAWFCQDTLEQILKKSSNNHLTKTQSLQGRSGLSAVSS